MFCPAFITSLSELEILAHHHSLPPLRLFHMVPAASSYFHYREIRYCTCGSPSSSIFFLTHRLTSVDVRFLDPCLSSRLEISLPLLSVECPRIRKFSINGKEKYHVYGHQVHVGLGLLRTRTFPHPKRLGLRLQIQAKSRHKIFHSGLQMRPIVAHNPEGIGSEGCTPGSRGLIVFQSKVEGPVRSMASLPAKSGYSTSLSHSVGACLMLPGIPDFGSASFEICCTSQSFASLPTSQQTIHHAPRSHAAPEHRSLIRWLLYILQHQDQH